MSVCDTITDEFLSRLASAQRRMASALYRQGVVWSDVLDVEEVAACTDLQACFPAEPTAEEGAADEA